KESRREGDKDRDFYTGGREDGDEVYRHVERRKEGSRDRRSDRERDIREERDKDKERRRERDHDHIIKPDRRRRDQEETQNRERDSHRQREKDKVKDKYTDEERARRRQELEKEVRKEEGDQEYKHYRDPRSHVKIDKGGSEYNDKYNRERRERHRERDRQGEEYATSRSEKGRRERHTERKQSEHHEGKGMQKHHSEYREHRDRKRTEEEVRHHRSDREEEPRGDKHREKKHKEEKDLKERTQETDKELQQTRLSHSQEAEETKVGFSLYIYFLLLLQIVNENEPEQEYEDDFEEYEDDFEELDESENEDAKKQELVEDKEELSPEKREEIKAIQRAMDEENKKVGALSRQNTTEIEEERPKWSRESERTESQTPQCGKFMDFVAAKQREVNKKVATKQKKRGTELLRLIDLDFTLTSSLLDLPPVNEYDMYIRNFGTANTKQAYVQCNEDNADRDIQTEEIELCEKWTQHPQEHSGACGDPNNSSKARDGALNELNIDSKRLTTFLQSASQVVMIVLLEEDQAERNSLRKLNTQTDVLSFSDGSLQLNTKLPFLLGTRTCTIFLFYHLKHDKEIQDVLSLPLGRHISLIHFSEVQKHTMISVHTTTTKPSAVHLDNHTLICIWNIWEPSRPQKILLYESEVQCCCFSPGKATLVFAGTTVGSVVLWDLREHTSNHHQMTIGGDEWTFRQPSFSTDAVMSASGHFSTVMSVEVVPSVVIRGQRSEVSLWTSEEGMGKIMCYTMHTALITENYFISEATGLSFQLASLDESGILNFWVVVELPKANEAGSQTDLGLRPGGKVKLLHSSSLSVVDRMSHKANKSTPLQTLQLKFLPTDSNHFFIGTNMGIVHHGTSHGLKALPKSYRCQEGDEKPTDISSVSFSPFRQDLFL
ncbi:hypothetical protein NL108_011214, partial [Boleophthalmus pectinirostris]